VLDLRDNLDPATAVRLFMAGLLGLQVEPPTSNAALREDLDALAALFLDDDASRDSSQRRPSH
jgi:hypothetical protein